MLSVAIEAAKDAGKFLKYSIGRVRNVETKKGEVRNLVSEIDKMSEEKIIGTIKRHFPNHAILAEESGGTESQAEYKWIIDPLDGTTNYTHGFPVFCVSIGIEHKEKLIAGVIYDPNFDELFTAERGKGAFLNGKKISVSKRATLNESMLVTGFPYNISENPNRAIERFINFLVKAQAVRRMGSAAIDLAYVAAGRYEGFWEVALNPWDVAAGVLLIEEAGGKVTSFDGGAYSIYKPELLASNGIVHQQMIEVVGSKV